MKKLFPFLLILIIGCTTTNAQIFDKIKKKVGSVTEKISLKKLQRDPVSTSFSDVDKRNTKPISFGVNTIYVDIQAQPFSNEQGYQLSPGYYETTFHSFCIKAGTYAPTSGSGRFYAELDGPKADIFETILTAFEEDRVEKRDAQLLFWAIIAKTDFSKMKGEIKAIALNILSPEEIARLSTNAIENLGKRELRKLSYKSDAARAIIDAENNLRSKYYNAVNNYAAYEEIAMLAGTEPIVSGWESGKWTMHPDGYYIRYYPTGYAKTKTQVFVPENAGTVYFNGFGDVAVPAHTSSQRLLQSNKPVGGSVILSDTSHIDDATTANCDQVKFNRKIDNNAHAKMEEWKDSKCIQSFSFTPNGGWVLISKNNEYVAENIPEKCRERIEYFQSHDIAIKEVVFPPNGGGNSWLIITENSTFSKNIPTQCYAQIKKLEGEGKTIQSVAFPYINVFGSGESWVILTRDGKHYTKNIPDECYQMMRNIRQTDMPNKAPERKITKVSFSPNGGWVVMAEDYYFTYNVPYALNENLEKFKGRSYQPIIVAFDPDKDGWSIVADKITKSIPNNLIRNIENELSDGRSIWQIMSLNKVPGVAIAVSINGKLAWKTGYGLLEKGNKKLAAHPESMFQVASISKAVAAVGAFIMIEDESFGLTLTENLLTSGKLKDGIPLLDITPPIPFDDCVEDENWATNFNRVTIENILQHTSGIQGRGSVLDEDCNYLAKNDDDDWIGGGYGGYTYDEDMPNIAQLFNKVRITYHPTQTMPNGRNSWYSGMAFTVLQKLTEDVTGNSYDSWMKTNLLNKLDMQKSAFTVEPKKRYGNDFSRGHDSNGKAYPIQRYPQYAAAGLYSSAEELLNFPIMINNNGVFNGERVLTQTSITNLVDNHMGVDVKKNRYAHGGTNTGFKAYFTGIRNINKDGVNNAAIVVLTNGKNNIRWLIAKAIMDEYGWYIE